MHGLSAILNDLERLKATHPMISFAELVLEGAAMGSLVQTVAFYAQLLSLLQGFVRSEMQSCP